MSRNTKKPTNTSTTSNGRKRRGPDACMTIRLYRRDQVDDLIKRLRKARKTCLHRGGNKTVTAHDCRHEQVRVHLEIDLTAEALRRHV